MPVYRTRDNSTSACARSFADTMMRRSIANAYTSMHCKLIKEIVMALKFETKTESLALYKDSENILFNASNYHRSNYWKPLQNECAAKCAYLCRRQNADSGYFDLKSIHGNSDKTEDFCYSCIACIKLSNVSYLSNWCDYENCMFLISSIFYDHFHTSIQKCAILWINSCKKWFRCFINRNDSIQMHNVNQIMFTGTA